MLKSKTFLLLICSLKRTFDATIFKKLKKLRMIHSGLLLYNSNISGVTKSMFPLFGTGGLGGNLRDSRKGGHHELPTG